MARPISRSKLIDTDLLLLQKGHEKSVSSFARAFFGGGLLPPLRLPITAAAKASNA